MLAGYELTARAVLWRGRFTSLSQLRIECLPCGPLHHGRAMTTPRERSPTVVRVAIALLVIHTAVVVAACVAYGPRPSVLGAVALSDSALLVVAGVVLITVYLRPVSHLAATSRRLASGEDPAVPYARRRDEVGDLARALASWRAAEASQRTIAWHLPIALFTLSPAGRVLTVNPTTERMTGYTAAEYARMTLEDLVRQANVADRPPSELADLGARYARFLAGETDAFLFEGPLLKKDGSTFRGALTMVSLRGEDGVPSRLVGMVQDVTEQMAWSTPIGG
jgi:PAS domain S-box-containing protein